MHDAISKQLQNQKLPTKFIQQLSKAEKSYLNLEFLNQPIFFSFSRSLTEQYRLLESQPQTLSFCKSRISLIAIYISIYTCKKLPNISELNKIESVISDFDFSSSVDIERDILLTAIQCNSNIQSFDIQKSAYSLYLLKQLICKHFYKQFNTRLNAWFDTLLENLSRKFGIYFKSGLNTESIKSKGTLHLILDTNSTKYFAKGYESSQKGHGYIEPIGISTYPLIYSSKDVNIGSHLPSLIALIQSGKLKCFFDTKVKCWYNVDQVDLNLYLVGISEVVDDDYSRISESLASICKLEKFMRF